MSGTSFIWGAPSEGAAALLAERAMKPIAQYESMDRERFEREIVPKGEPAVFRGLVADWPVVRAGKDGPEALAQMLRFAATDEPFQAWFAQPQIEGRFHY